jgi:hypothetical protein
VEEISEPFEDLGEEKTTSTGDLMQFHTLRAMALCLSVVYYPYAQTTGSAEAMRSVVAAAGLPMA